MASPAPTQEAGPRGAIPDTRPGVCGSITELPLRPSDAVICHRSVLGNVSCHGRPPEEDCREVVLEEGDPARYPSARRRSQTTVARSVG